MLHTKQPSRCQAAAKWEPSFGWWPLHGFLCVQSNSALWHAVLRHGTCSVRMRRYLQCGHSTSYRCTPFWPCWLKCIQRCGRHSAATQTGRDCHCWARRRGAAPRSTAFSFVLVYGGRREWKSWLLTTLQQSREVKLRLWCCAGRGTN